MHNYTYYIRITDLAHPKGLDNGLLIPDFFNSKKYEPTTRKKVPVVHECFLYSK
jgi:hypothetical protein